MIIKYRHYFSKFILNSYDNKREHKYIYRLIKTIVCDERGTLICETILIDITNKIKKEIIINKNSIKEKETENISKLAYLLKISKIISLFAPVYLRKTSLIEIIDDYIKDLIIKYDQEKLEKLEENMIYEKVIKYWLDLNKIHIEIFKNRNKYILSLFFFKSMKNLSKIEKNKIIIFITYRLCLNASDKNSEKKYKSIMKDFIKLDNETIEYFDIFVEELIIPMMIRYLKNINFFKCFSISINKDNSLKVNINNSQTNENK
jgi:hypothetical protein